MSTGGRLEIRDGTAQGLRLLPALEAGYFKADEMGFEQLLSLSTDFASNLNFFNLNNYEDGDWGDIFLSHSVVIAAAIISTDIEKEQYSFARIVRSDHRAAVTSIYQMARRIDRWHQQRIVDAGQQEERLADLMADVITQQLAGIFQQFSAEVITRFSTAEYDFTAFGNIWSLVSDRKSAVDKLSGLANKSEDFQELLNKTFSVLCSAVAYLQKEASKLLPMMLATGNQDPSLALFMVFLRLYRSAQNELNGFTAKHLDFYYRKYLQFLPAGCTPDSAYLVFKNVVNDGGLVPKGAAFSGGKGLDGQEVIFTADNQLQVTDARVAALNTLHLSRSKLISPEHELAFAAGIYCKDISSGKEQLQSNPLFGAAENGVEASIGFAVASTNLFLREGRRRVSVKLNISLPTNPDNEGNSVVRQQNDSTETTEYRELVGRYFRERLLVKDYALDEELIEADLSAAAPLSNKARSVIRDLLTQDANDLFYRFFRQMFKLSVTSTSDWYEVVDYALFPDEEPQSPGGLSVVLEFILGPDHPPVIAYDESLHGRGYTTSLPLLRLLLDPQAPLYPYSFLADLQILNITIDTRVEGITDLLLYNNHGQLDPAAPFAPFGPIPSTASYLSFGNYEMAKKNLLSCELNIAWGDIPKEEGGFAEYYRGYDSSLDNDSFKIKVSALCDGHWQEESATDNDRSLFQARSSTGQLKPHKQLVIEGSGSIKALSSAVSEGDYRFNQRARNGFLRISLIEPVSAFGHKEYPGLLSRVLTENARRKRRQKPVPVQPFTPMISRLTLDYSARSVLRPGPEQRETTDHFAEAIFHVHPLGVEKVDPTDIAKPCTILPEYRQNGNLYIGISASNLRDCLTLFFHLHGDSVADLRRDRPKISWACLCADQWELLSQDRVLADSTSGFLKSGVVTLDLPGNMDIDHTVMPPGLFWIRVSTNGTSDDFCRLYEVQTQAVRVTRQGEFAGEVPADKIIKPVNSLFGTGEPEQPLESFGGSPPENDRHLLVKTSERLRHKNRAVTAWDYERLVLEQFPGLCKVKCFPHMSSENGVVPHPGRVLVVVVPMPGANGQEQVNAGELQEVHDFITGLTMPFAEVEVRNPVYEFVQVRCAVTFTATAATGDSIRRLNQALSDYLSPWNELGCQVKFGWSVRREEIEAFIRSLDYVEFVTDFSLLHICRDDHGSYSLDDSVPHRGRGSGSEDSAIDRLPGNIEMECIRPKLPWSLVSTAPKHFIKALDCLEDIEPMPTGIDELEIGNTFIIGGR